MKVLGVSRGFGICLIWASLASGQTLPVSAKIEAVPLEFDDARALPDGAGPRGRSVGSLWWLRGMGLVRSFSVQLGATVREAQEVTQLDRSEAAARLKVALAEVKEKQALVKRQARDEVSEAQLEGAQARAELAQIELDRCTLHAPVRGPRDGDTGLLRAICAQRHNDP